MKYDVAMLGHVGDLAGRGRSDHLCAETRLLGGAVQSAAAAEAAPRGDRLHEKTLLPAQRTSL